MKNISQQSLEKKKGLIFLVKKRFAAFLLEEEYKNHMLKLLKKNCSFLYYSAFYLKKSVSY